MIKAPIQTGHRLSAISVNEYKAQGVSTLNQLEAFGLQRPSVLQDATERTKKSDPKLKMGSDSRAAVQRSFDKSRINNAKDYSIYIERVESGQRDGGTPAITLYCEEHLVETGDGGIVIPYNSTITAIDGETQTEARFMLRERLPETGNIPVAVTVYHGISKMAARQTLHDYNHHVTPMNEKQTAGLNHEGALTKAVNAAIVASGTNEAKINRFGSVAKKSAPIASTQQLLMFVCGYSLGADAMKGNVKLSDVSRLNNSTGNLAVDPKASIALASVMPIAIANPEIGRSNLMLWQVAGVLMAAGRPAESLKWDAAIVAYNATKSGGRGGERVSTASRLKVIAGAM